MNFGKAFGFVFDDRDWVKKLLIGGVISVVPIFNLAALGYSLEVARRVIDGDPKPLPGWDDFGGKMLNGLLVAVIVFVYMLPVIILAGTALALINALDQSPYPIEQVRRAAEVSWTCFGCVSFMYAAFAGWVLPAAVGTYAAQAELGAALRFGEVFGLVQKNLGQYLTLLVFLIPVFIVAGLGSIVCCVGVFFTGFYSLVSLGHATGQAYRAGKISQSPGVHPQN